MRSILFLSLFVALLSCNAEKAGLSNDLKVDNVAGAAETVIYNKYYVDESVMQVQKASLESRKVFTYNKDGNIITEIQYDIRGNVTEHSEYKYNTKGDRISKVSSDGKGKNVKTITYYYDTKGYQNKALYEEAGLPVGNFIEFELDDRKNKVAENFFRGSDSTQYARVEYEYDENRKLVSRKSLNMSGEVTDNYTQTFDGKGNLKSFKAYNPDGSIKALVFYNYDEFDAQGNWMVRYEFFGDSEKPFLITEREITYYD